MKFGIFVLPASLLFVFSLSAQTLSSVEKLNQAIASANESEVFRLLTEEPALLQENTVSVAPLAVSSSSLRIRRQIIHFWKNATDASEPTKEALSTVITAEIEALKKIQHHSDKDIQTIVATLAVVHRFELRQNFYDVLLFATYPLVDVRKASYKALGAFKDDRMFPVIMQMAASPDPLMRTYALDALYYIKDERTMPLLLNALKDTNKSVRYYAIRTIENMEATEATPYFIRLVQDDVDSEVRIKAMQVLAKQKVRSAFSVIARTVYDNDPNVRSAAVSALLGYNDTSGCYYISEQLAKESQDQLKEQQIKALIAMRNSGGMTGLNQIILKESNRFVKLWAIYAAGYLADARGYDAVMRTLDESDIELRTEAAAATGMFKNRKSVTALVSLVQNDPEYAVRSAALLSLQKIDNEESYADLFDISQEHQDKRIRIQATEVLKILLHARYKK